MWRVGWITLLPLCLTSFGNQGEVNGNCKDDHLQTQINKLVEEMEQMRHMVEQLHSNTVKSDLGSIEDDVKQNAEDIIELRVDVIQQDYRINQVNHDVKNLNTSLNQVNHDVKNLNTSLNQVNHDVENLNTSLKETLAPVGSILAWHAGFFIEKSIPVGWQRCDGSLIEMGPLAGKHTPNLNSGRFLRGGADGQSGEFEEDAIQDHIHMDEGHSHSDLGHTHKDQGHSHVFSDDYFLLYMHSDDPTIDCGGHCNYYKTTKKTPIGYSQLTTESANIETSTSNLGGIEEGRMADETRVKNMKIVWIMRIF